MSPISAQAVCLCHVLINLTQEPACFIVANAMTTLCAGVFGQSTWQLLSYLRAAFLFAVMLTVPIGMMLFVLPVLISWRIKLPVAIASSIHEYAPYYTLAVAPSLLLAALLGYLRAQGKLRSTALICCLMPIPNVRNRPASPTFSDNHDLDHHIFLASRFSSQCLWYLSVRI